MRLKDKVAIVTGGGTGIGKAIALTFAAEGARVVIASRTLSNLEEAVKEIKSAGGVAKAIQTDISDEKQVQSMATLTLEAYGQIDVLVNNSAAPPYTDAPIADIDLNSWNEILKVNLTGTMLCCREVLKNMIPRRAGSIINISSIAGVTGTALKSAYGVSKWGIIGLTETLAAQVGAYSIRVNSISPAATRNERFTEAIRDRAKYLGISYEEFMARITKHHALRRIAEASEVATSALFLATNDSGAITGHNLIVSCGMRILHPDEI